jgi:23S rRNA (uracil1939-C5)-methyltransferase
MLVEIHITDWGADGDGVGYIDGEKIFVPFTAPGDKAIITIEKVKKRTYIHLREILEPSPIRRSAPCQHFGLCGGCRLQHIHDQAYEELKLNHVRRHLDFFGINTYQLSEIQRVAPKARRRITLQYRKRDGVTTVGFAIRGTHRLIDIKECHLVSPAIGEMIPALRDFLSSWLTSGTGHVNLLATPQGLDIDIHNGQIKKLGLEDHERFAAFARQHNLARISYKNRVVVEHRKPMISFAGYPVEVSAQGFLQASDEADLLLQEAVSQFLPSPVYRIADLFCGRGTFTMMLQKYGKVDGYELDDPALSALNAAVNLFCLPVQTFSRNLFDQPLQPDELNVYDAVVIDPPRAGALHQCQQLAASKVSRLIYVSCNPASFARDAKILTDGGYCLENVIPVDQFLWSEHLELVGHFRR